MGFSSDVQAGKLTVITTIKPLHSLVASVMGERLDAPDVTLDLMVAGGLDPHMFRLKPSMIRQIHNADLVFYIDSGLEAFLKPMVDRDHGRFKAIAMAQQENIRIMPRRSGKVWYQDTESVAHAGGAQDLHIWLDPVNARHMIDLIEKNLSAADPDYRLTYIENAQATIARLYRVEETIREQLRPLRQKPMLVYHDAFQYFEQAFGLKTVGAIMARTDQPPSIKHVRSVKALAREKHVTCVLGVPGSHPRIATAVMSGTDAGFGILDPLGLYLSAGPDLYFQVMVEMAQNIVDCQDGFDRLDDLVLRP